MPMATVTPTTSGGTGQTSVSGAAAAGAAASPAGLNPFPRASYLYREQWFDQTISGVTTGQAAPVGQVPAYGFLRSLLYKFTVTTTGGTPTLLNADAPFSIIQSLILREPNGYQLVNTDGFGLYCINKYGGYRYQNDAKLWFGYSASPTNSVFFLRVPIEIDVRDALGSLANQNTGNQFAVEIQLNSIAAVWAAATPPTGYAIRIQSWAEEWDQPATSTLDVPNQVAPMALGTTPQWSRQQYQYSAGQFTIPFRKQGLYLRNLLWVFRGIGATAPREDDMPNYTTLALDSQVLDHWDVSQFKQTMSERYGYTGALDAANALDTGVYCYDFTSDFSGKPGFETRQQWLYTLPSTRLDFSGVFPLPGTLTVYTNEVAAPQGL